MPPDTTGKAKIFSLKRLPYRLFIITAVFLSVLMFSCSKEDKKQHLEEKLTDTKPIVSPIISTNENISKGNDFFLKGEFQNAIDFYKGGLAQNRSVAFYNMGVSYYLLGNIAKSEESFRMAVEENPEFKEAYMNLAVVLIQTGKLDEAEKYVSELLKDSNSAKMLVNMANIHLKRGETAKAALYYQEAMKKGENSKYVRSNYAYFLMSIGEYKDGIAILENLSVKDYTDYYNLASAYYNEGMYEQAVANVTKALSYYQTEEAMNLAALGYFALGDFKSCVSMLKGLIEKFPAEDYHFRLAKALFYDGALKEANKEITDLIAKSSEKPEYYRLKYEILLGMGEINEAGKLAADAYERFKTDDVFYTLVKHRIIYHEDLADAEKILAEDRTSPFLNLARTAYYILKDKMVPARQFINDVPPKTDNDYYIYQAYIALKYKEYDTVLQYAQRINKVKPEYFWFKAAANYNTGNIAGLKKALAEQVARKAVFGKGTNVNFHLIPRMSDVDFSYKFDGEYENILSLLMYPLFIEPSEMMNFVAMGYKMLKENEKLVALRELERSVNYSEGIRLNNDGVADMFQYKFSEAYKKFSRANDMLNNNPYTLYNMGLAKLNLGEIEPAWKNFDTAILQNNYFLPAYLGMAVTLKAMGRGSPPSEYYNSIKDRALQSVEDKRNLPEPILYASFLADLGLGRYSMVKEDIGNHINDNIFFKSMAALSDYLSGKGYGALTPLNTKKPIYRGRQVRDLLGTLDGDVKDVDTALLKDRAYKFMKTYAMLKKGLKPPLSTYDEYVEDNIALKELVYYSIIARDKETALRYLQQVSHLDIRYKELYKASLYYFLWTEDFVNAEASYMALANLKANDRYVDYYKLLYFVLNFNSKRLVDNITEYMKKHPSDPVGKEVRMLYSLRSENFEMTLNSINDIEKDRGNFLRHLPLEISIDGL